MRERVKAYLISNSQVGSSLASGRGHCPFRAGSARRSSFLVGVDAASAAARARRMRLASQLDDAEAAARCREAAESGAGAIRFGGSLALRQPLAALERQLPALRCLDLSHCIYVENRTVPRVLRWLPNLIELDLTCCYELTDSAIVQLAGLRHLERLSLEGCSQVSDAGLGPILVASASRLKHLNIAGLLEVTDAGLLAAGAAEEPAWRNLESFDCTACFRLGHPGLKSVLEPSLPRQLRSLKLGGVRYALPALICEPLDLVAPQLADLDLEGCVQMDARVGQAIADDHRFPALRRVRLAACPRLPPAACEAVRAARPKLLVDDAVRMAWLDGGLRQDQHGVIRLLHLALKFGVMCLVGWGVFTVWLGVVPAHVWVLFISASVAITLAYLTFAIGVFILTAAF
mmetsp:Transcript_22982/g.65263  ORF Transcript_22982/g.65263 Transcript_22982/m.65263 type:complete len:403 (-) Transcript_22982:2885-4093(-)